MFGFLTLFAKSWNGTLIESQVNSMLRLEVLNAVLDEDWINVGATEVWVATSCHNFYDSIFNLKNRHIKGSTSEVKDKDSLHPSLHLIESIGYSSSCWLIDNSAYLETSNRSSIHSCLLLSVIEVCGHSNDRLFHTSLQESLCIKLQLLKDFRRYLFWVEFLLLTVLVYHNQWSVLLSLRHPERQVELAIPYRGQLRVALSDDAFRVKNRVLWVSMDLVKGCLSNDNLLLWFKSHTWRSYWSTLVVLEDLDPAISPEAYAWILSAQVYANPRLAITCGSPVGGFNHCRLILINYTKITRQN